jgi:hypothetical protein
MMKHCVHYSPVGGPTLGVCSMLARVPKEILITHKFRKGKVIFFLAWL